MCRVELTIYSVTQNIANINKKHLEAFFFHWQPFYDFDTKLMVVAEGDKKLLLFSRRVKMREDNPGSISGTTSRLLITRR